MKKMPPDMQEQTGQIAQVLGIGHLPNYRLIVVFTEEDGKAAIMSRTENPEMILKLLEAALETIKISILNRN